MDKKIEKRIENGIDRGDREIEQEKGGCKPPNCRRRKHLPLMLMSS